MVQQLERHFETYVRGVRREVNRAIGRMVGTMLVAFVIVAAGGSAALTAVVYALNQTPGQPLAIVSYILLAVAALAIGMAAGAFFLIAAVLRGLVLAGRFVLDEIARGEREVAHALPGIPGSRSSAPER